MHNAPPDEAIREFPSLLAIDTCAVWNLLCSRVLCGAAKEVGRHFLIVDYVRYECLDKPRKNPSALETKLQRILKSELDSKQHFSSLSVEVSDIADLIAAIGPVKSFHKGEIAALALARKLHHGFMTDDRAAKDVGQRVLGQALVRTTPHLVGWLVYRLRLGDGDIATIVDDNKALRGDNGHLGAYIHACYVHAMGLRLRDQ